MELLTEFIAILLTGLSAILATIGAAASRRFGDSRLGLVAGGLAFLAGIGVLAFLHEVSPLYGGPFEVAPVPLALAVAAVALLYVALIRGRPKAPSP
ncbi:MAG: hypothetical protein L3K14_09935 [Thermoplasmata archaeon]|nr:hypothetical protein [Thermoplasmata archaeon]